jgi:death-on-curing protein
MIMTSGGSFYPPDNLLDRSSLEYILVAIRGQIFGRVLFPTLTEKAAALTYQIITSHVFFDGNKRTGIHTAWEFLQANKVRIYLDHTAEEIAVGIATNTITRSELCRWLREHKSP